VHATFTEFGDAGKRWRMLESGLWAVVEPAYFEQGNYLTFDIPAAPSDPAPCVGGPCGEDQRHGLGPQRAGNMLAIEALKRSSRLRANVELMAVQLHALRDAMAVARVLNRTLIVPLFECLCDRSELTDVIPSCLYPGAPRSMAFPFKCSTSFLLDTHKLQMLSAPMQFGMRKEKFGGAETPPLPIRGHSFLKDPRTSPDIKRSSSRVSLPRGSTNVQVLQTLQPFAASRVLHLTNAAGSFGGWETERQQAFLFNTLMEYFIYGSSWCCSSRNKDEGRTYPKMPPTLRIP